MTNLLYVKLIKIVRRSDFRMALLTFVFVSAFLCGIYGKWIDWLFLFVLYGGVIGFRQWVLWLCLFGGIISGVWKASKRDIPPLGYIEREIVVMSHPLLSFDGKYVHKAGDVVFSSSVPWLLGDTLHVRGYLRRRGEVMLLYPYEISLVKRQWGLSSLSQLYLWWQRKLAHHLPSSSARDMVFALVLGNRLHLDYTTKREFQLSGVFHLLAISGLHLALLAGILQKMLSFVFSRKVALFFSCLFVSGYTLALGMPAPMVRACLFLWGYFVLWDIRSQVYWLDWVFLVAALCCLCLPVSWLGVGFALSFLAVVGILLLVEPLKLLFQKIWPLDGILAATLSANLFTFPLLAMVFQEVSVVSLGANLLLVPFFPLFLVGCFGTALWGIFAPFPEEVMRVLDFGWQIMAGIIHIFSLGGNIQMAFSPRFTGWFYILVGTFFLWHMLKMQMIRKTG